MGVCYSLWVLFLLYGHWSTDGIHSVWIWASMLSAPLTHICAFALIAPFPWILSSRLRSPWRFILGLPLSLLTCGSVSVILPGLDGWLYSQAHIPFNSAKLITLYVVMVGPAMMVVGGLVAAHARSEELRKASEAEAHVAKNRLLQGQVHPHVLFNALNGLAELVHKDPKAAEGAIRHLSDLLRRILIATEHTRLPLGEERKIISDFLALESIRLGNRLRVVWEWDEQLDALELPPLLLQPLVENAIKHGISPSIPGGEVVLRAKAQDGAILLQVWNSGMPFQNRGVANGIGVKNLRSRLALSFGTGASLAIGPAIGPKGDGTLACIRLEATQVEFPHEPAEGPGR